MILHGIAVKPAKKRVVRTLKTGFITSTGIEGNYSAKLRGAARSRRQVTVISLEQWDEAMRELGEDMPWYMRRANLCVMGHRFGPEDVGKMLLIGADAILEITGETDPCKRMEEILPGLKEALTPSWRGGVTCRVCAVGAVSVGDTANLN